MEIVGIDLFVPAPLQIFIGHPRAIMTRQVLNYDRAGSYFLIFNLQPFQIGSLVSYPVIVIADNCILLIEKTYFPYLQNASILLIDFLS